MVDAPDLKSVVRIGRGSSSLPLGTKSKYIFDKMDKTGRRGEVANAVVCKTSIHGFESHRRLQNLGLGKYNVVQIFITPNFIINFHILF